jgi:hypothetical protein
MRPRASHTAPKSQFLVSLGGNLRSPDLLKAFAYAASGAGVAGPLPRHGESRCQSSNSSAGIGLPMK